MSKKDKDGFDLSKAKKIAKSRRIKLLRAAEAKLGKLLKTINQKFLK